MSNCILVCHAFSGSHHAAGKFDNDEKNGWWDEFIGPDKTIDTNRFFVISINNLGSCFGSTSPVSVNSVTGKPYRLTFPELAVEDMANASHLLLEKLGVSTINILIGPSLGGMKDLAYSIIHNKFVKNLLPKRLNSPRSWKNQAPKTH